MLSTRMPGVTNAMVEVTFGLPGEVLTLRFALVAIVCCSSNDPRSLAATVCGRHEAGASDDIFVAGSLLAAQAVTGRLRRQDGRDQAAKAGLTRGLNRLLFPSSSS